MDNKSPVRKKEAASRAFSLRCLQGDQFRRGFCPSEKPLFATLASTY